MKKWTSILIAAAFAAFCATADTPDELTAFEGRVIEAWSAVKSAAADVALAYQLEVQGLSLPMTAKGRVEYAKPEDKGLFRTELDGELSAPMGESTAKMPVNLISVFDGETVHTMTALFFQKIVMQSPMENEGLGAAAKALFENLRRDCVLKPLATRNIDGVAARGLEAVLKEQPEEADMTPPVKFHLYFAEDSLLPVQLKGFAADGRPLLTLNLTKLRVNPEIERSRFTFTPPPDARIIRGDEGDLSQLFPIIPAP